MYIIKNLLMIVKKTFAVIKTDIAWNEAKLHQLQNVAVFYFDDKQGGWESKKRCGGALLPS